MKSTAGSFALLAALLLGWEMYSRSTQLSELIAPAPSVVLHTLWQGLSGGFLWPHIGVTSFEIVVGLGIGCVIGFVAGVLLAEMPALQRLLYPYILASQVIPKLALGPLFVIWFGPGLMPTIVITALICFFPLLENTFTGIKHVDADKRELFRMLGAGRMQTLLQLKVPNALPLILAGVRVAVVLAFIGAIVGEFLSANQGLGALIISAQGMMDTSLMFAVFIVITVQGTLFYQLAVIAERRLLRHHTTRTTQ